MSQSIQTTDIQMFPDYLSTGLWTAPCDRHLSAVRILYHAGARISTLLSVYRWVSEWELWNIDMGAEYRDPAIDSQWIRVHYANWYQEGLALCQQLQLETGFHIEYCPDSVSEVERSIAEE